MCWQVRIQMAVRQVGHGVATEDRLGGREVELGQVEIRTPGVHAGIHVVSGTGLLRRWLTRPQLCGCLNPNKTRSRDASSIDFSRVGGLLFHVPVYASLRGAVALV